MMITSSTYVRTAQSSPKKTQDTILHVALGKIPYFLAVLKLHKPAVVSLFESIEGFIQAEDICSTRSILLNDKSNCKLHMHWDFEVSLWEG